MHAHTSLRLSIFKMFSTCSHPGQVKSGRFSTLFRRWNPFASWNFFAIAMRSAGLPGVKVYPTLDPYICMSVV